MSEVFRKLFDSDPSSLNEREICNIIKRRPHKNLVTVIDVQQTHVDEELLEVPVNREDFISRGGLRDILDALAHLHCLRVVYIDLKLDNIGWSKTDQCYKLFDFNGSGFIGGNGRFVLDVMRGCMYNRVNMLLGYDLGQSSDDNLFLYDFCAFRLFKEEETTHSCLPVYERQTLGSRQDRYIPLEK